MTSCPRCARPLTAGPENCPACGGTGQRPIGRGLATGSLVFNLAAVGAAFLAAGPLGLLEAPTPPTAALVLAIGLSVMLLAALYR